MKTFPNWRNAGRAMRWARQQDGVHVSVVGGGLQGELVENRWRRGGQDSASVEHMDGVVHGVGFTARTEDGLVELSLYDGVGPALRVLAALDLIPASLAYGPDERYGRCVKCGRIAQWWPTEVGALARWVHAKRLRFDLDPHEAEVAG